MVAAWTGTEQDATDLERVIMANCSCPKLADGSPDRSCNVHKIWRDEKLLARLLFGRALCERLRTEEFRRTPLRRKTTG